MSNATRHRDGWFRVFLLPAFFVIMLGSSAAWSATGGGHGGGGGDGGGFGGGHPGVRFSVGRGFGDGHFDGRWFTHGHRDPEVLVFQYFAEPCSGYGAY